MNERRIKLLYWLSLASVGLIFTILYGLYPYLNDDVWYRESWQEFIDSPSAPVFFKNWWDSISLHYLIDNGRLSNIIGTVAVVSPKWIVAVFMSGCLCASIYLSAKIAGIWRRNFALYSAIVFLTVFFLPWADYMFGIIYSINYIPTTALMLLVLWLVLHGKIRHTFLSFLLGLFVSFYHELFGGCLLAGVGALVVFHKEYRTKTEISLCIGAVLGILYLFWAPGTSARAENIDFFVGLKNPLFGAAHGLLFYCLVAIAAALLFNRKTRPILRTPVSTSLLAMAVAGYLAWRIFVFRLHVAWCMDMVSITAIAYLINYSLPELRNRAFIFITSLLAWGLVIAHLCFCIPWFNIMRNEVRMAHEAIEKSSEPFAFTPLTSVFEVPAYLLGKPNFNAYTIWATGFDEAVPQELEEFMPAKAKPIGENCTAWLFAGKYIVVPECDTYIVARDSTYITIGGTAVATDARYISFRGSDGRNYYYLRPFQIPLRLASKSIEKLSI